MLSRSVALIPASRLVCKKYEWVQLLQEAGRNVPPPKDSHFPERLNFSERGTLLRDFFKIHEWTFKGGIRHVAFAMKHQRGRPIDPTIEGISISLRYRPGNNGNPARTFRLIGMGTYKKSDLAKWGRAGPQLDAEGRKRQEEAWRTEYGERYIGSLTVLFEAEELKLGIQHPFLHFSPGEEAYLALADPNWLDELRDNVDAGLVFEPSANGKGAQRILPGEMCKEGRVWKWKQLPLDDKSVPESKAMAQYNKIQLNQTLDL